MQEGGDITALGKEHKAHARVAQDGGEAKELMVAAVLVIAELTPVELHLLTGLGLIAPHGMAAGLGRAQRLDKGFELAHPAGVAERP